MRRLTLCGDFSPQRIRVNEVDEGPFPIDLHHRQPLPIGSLELGIRRDIHLLEPQTGIDEHLAGPLAEVTPGRVVEDDAPGQDLKDQTPRGRSGSERVARPFRGGELIRARMPKAPARERKGTFAQHPRARRRKPARAPREAAYT